MSIRNTTGFRDAGWLVTPETILSHKQGSTYSILPSDRLKIIGDGHLISHSGAFPWQNGHDAWKMNYITYSNKKDVEIVDSKLLSNNEEAFIFNSKFKNTQDPQQSIAREGIKNGIIPKNLGTDSNRYYANHDCLPVVNVTRKLTNQYGGNTYYDRINNQYIDCNQYQIGNNIKVLGGDTYICMFDYLNIFLDTSSSSWEVNNYDFENIYFPVETCFNLNYRTDISLHSAQISIPGAPIRLQETAGFYSNGSDSFSQDKDLYLINTVYLKQNEIRKYYPKPLNFEGIKTYNTRLLASERKVPNEEIDSWTQFLPQNYIDLSKRWGAVTGVINSNNYFYAIQEHAVGVTSIDERSIITDNNISELVLGTGGVLVRHDYTNTISGSKHKWSILTTLDGVMYYDSTSKGIYHISGASVSDVKGLRSYFTQFDDTVEVNGYYNMLYKEAVWSFNSDTLSYNCLSKTYQSYFSFSSPQYIVWNNKLLTVLRTSDKVYGQDPDKVYLHGIGYNRFYEQDYDSIIRFIVNKGFAQTKIFDSTMCYFNETIESRTQQQGFFSKVRVWNDYQYSGPCEFLWKATLAQKEGVGEVFYTRKQRTFSFFPPRNAVNKNLDTNPDIFTEYDQTRTFKERMRDKYMMVELGYTAAQGDSAVTKHMNFPFIITNFRYVSE